MTRLLGLALLAFAMVSSQGGGAAPGLRYIVPAAEPWGPKWRRRRPPGLPARARRTADRQSSADALAHYLHSYPDAEFRRVVLGLAQTESATRLGRPANNYNGSSIRAFGIFNWNTLATPSDALRLPVQGGGSRVVRAGWRTVRDPVDWTPTEEVTAPLKTYWLIWRSVRDLGGDARAAGRAVRLWHRRPASYRRYIEAGPRLGWGAAWARVEQDHAAVIDRHLRGVV